MEYTKGEWKLEGNKVKVHGSGTIAICPSPSTSEGVFEFIANAHLIAAAPAMYQALTHLVERHEQGLALGEALDLKPAREALALAEGRE